MSFLAKVQKKYIVASNQIEIYRKILVPDGKQFLDALKKGEYLSPLKGLGVFWSTDIESAYVGWNHEDGEEVVLNGYIHPNAILKQGLHDDEVVLKEGSTIELYNILLNGKVYNLKHRAFKA